MIRQIIIFSLVMLFSINNGFAVTLLQGYVYTTKPIVSSLVIVRDAANNSVMAMTDERGFYQLDASELVAPLILSSDNDALNLNHYQGNIDSASHRVASLLNTLEPNQVNIVNLSSFTDLLVSDLAVELGYIGPEQLISKGIMNPLKRDMLDGAYRRFHQMFDQSLLQVGINPQQFDPINTTAPSVNELLALILHNRSYDSKSGEIGATVLFDMSFKPLSEDIPFDFNQALSEKNNNLNAKKRIFIISDSTAANYTRQVYPRMGWGQVFEQFIAKNNRVVVINGAQSGRSSRSFYNEGWFTLLEPQMQKGDYLLIAFGHNDEKCDGSKLDRGQADVSNLCTYPNDIDNQQQYPDGQEYMSFQNSLERYINLAKAKGVLPILMTPVTRFRNGNNNIAYQNSNFQPVVSTHFTRKKNGFSYWGNYSDTVKHAAKVADTPLIDLEQLSITFANQHKDDWQHYWLVVDPNDARYPYYKTQSSGTISNPDITHFQEDGALAIAQLIIRAIKVNTSLDQLSILLDSHEVLEK